MRGEVLVAILNNILDFNIARGHGVSILVAKHARRIMEVTGAALCGPGGARYDGTGSCC